MLNVRPKQCARCWILPYVIHGAIDHLSTATEIQEISGKRLRLCQGLFKSVQCASCFFPTWTWHGESMRRTIMINYINYICTMYMCFPTTRINGLIFIWKFFSQTPQAPQLRLRHPFQLQNLFRSSHMCHPSFSMVSQLHQLQVPNLKEVGTVLSQIQSVNLGEDVIDVRDKLN